MVGASKWFSETLGAIENGVEILLRRENNVVGARERNVVGVSKRFSETLGAIENGVEIQASRDHNVVGASKRFL